MSLDAPAAPSPSEISALVERFARGATLPAHSIAGLSRDQLLAAPIPGKWSTQQVIIHLMDSDLIGTDRMKRIAAEKNPLIIAYNESDFIRELHPERLDAALACEVFRLNRILTAEVLRSLPPSAWTKTGVHNENGKKTLAQMVAGYGDHLDGHLTHIYAKRRALHAPIAETHSVT
jgi:hypothetical protein